MADLYRNKYRSASARHPGWDYGGNAAYFVTICTRNRQHYFGRISDGTMILSDIGNIVESEWLKTFEMRPDMNLQMGEFVVMPDHFHAIIIIGKNKYNSPDTDAMHCVSAIDAPAANDAPDGMDTNGNPKNQFGPQSKNLASIIRGFKIGVTKNSRPIDPDFAWQSRFHDHIIRDQKSFHNISKYIVDNPLKWKMDKLNQR